MQTTIKNKSLDTIFDELNKCKEGYESNYIRAVQSGNKKDAEYYKKKKENIDSALKDMNRYEAEKTRKFAEAYDRKVRKTVV